MSDPGLQAPPWQPTTREVGRRFAMRGLGTRAGEIFAEAPDHYELLDRRLVGPLAGFLYCCAGLIACVLLAIDPPTVTALDGLGWLPAGALTGLAFVFGVLMVVSRRIPGPSLLLAIGFSGPVMLATLQWLAGATGGFDEIVLLSVIWCAVVLPGPRLLAVVLVDSIVLFLPAAYDGWHADLLPQQVAELGVMWTIAVVCLFWGHHVRTERRRLHAQREAADGLARIDPLTGLGNRRAMDETLAAQVALAGRTGRPLAALVGDVDGFKAINDRHGHQLGDELLREVAAVVRDVVRRPDACFRWGGDEFVVLLAEVGEADAHEVAARIATAVAARCRTPEGTPIGLSLGIAVLADGTSGVQLLADADAALLAVKSQR
jgi:diguanylate cyclase (GGDEF)-like protein